MVSDCIEKHVEIQAPVSRVWQALTDHNQFGEWFLVKLNGPFVAGETTTGNILYPGYEHLKMDVAVQKIEPETFFSFRWHPYAVDPEVDYSQEQPTLVEFVLKPSANGTHVTVTESGFDAIPAARREEAFRMNDGGWEEQLQNIKNYVHAHPNAETA